VAEAELEEGELELDPREKAEIAARRRMALAQIRQYPDPALRLRANDVDEFDDSLAQLAERMTELMHDARGVGLAATQLGVLQRIFVFQAHDEDDVHVLANPRITPRSTQAEIADEGCLSLQGVLVPVERSLAVTLEGQDVRGAPVRLELEDMAARIVQHEVDHLDGVLILERTDPESRRQALAVLRRPPSL
jgi:peptide deformylase